ncbi:hypothetical protein F5Y14DRAFT_145388 [Nemania sp. NC0429]|nr:hypothetical protein F5Y14DRAFT_145388 [Nemania sp. NC0429]
MASVASASPSGQGFLYANSTEDTDSWQYVDTNSSPAGYAHSPGSSLNGWGTIGYPNHLGPSPTAMSPPTSHPAQQGTVNSTAEENVNQFFSLLDNQQLMADHDFFFPDPFGGSMGMGSFQLGPQEENMGDMSNFEEIGIQAEPADLDIPIQFQDSSNVAPWAPTNIQDDDFMFFAVEEAISPTPSQRSPGAHSHRSSPGIPPVKHRHAKDTDLIKKVRGSSRIEKKKPAPVDNFVIVTPNTIHQQSGKPNPFECFEIQRGVQRGRKGPLADKAAESALNVRRMGACFCCRSRKVKCDEERPCKNCKKMATQVPHVVCWQFSDFMPVLFPGFIRGHFKKEVIARFISENVSEFYSPPSASFEPCLIELSSGSRFRSTLTLPASFFVPKSIDVLQHWHMGIGMHQLDLQLRAAVPIGIDPKNSTQREALRRRTREYIHSLVDEPQYSEQVTDSLRGTQLPRRVLTIVQRFAQRSKSTMVKRALAIYAAHYVLTRQLCLTPGTLARLHALQQTHPEKLPFALPNSNAYSSFTTTRILNRQVKAALNEFLQKETQALFTSFGSALKPRSRAEWAGCLASFLVLCLLFEGIEAAADTFVVSEAEIALRMRRRSVYNAAAAPPDENKVGGGGGFAVGGRRQALDVCREIDNLPFRQVAYRFHAVYQTHPAREQPGTAKGPVADLSAGNGAPTFNPLLDASLDSDLEPAAAEMAASLRALLDNDDSCEYSVMRISSAPHL